MSVRTRGIDGFLAALATFLILFYWRHFFPQHAALVGVAVGALVYTTLGTVQRLGHTYRRKGPRSIRPRDEGGPGDKPDS